MATFTLGTELATNTPTVTVDGGLPPGVYRIQLIVEDVSDRLRPVASAPKFVTLVIRAPVIG